MKTKTIRIISIVVTALIVIALGTFIVSKVIKHDELVTITFETGDGSKVDPIEISKGTKLDNVPQSFFAGHSFIGWYEDEGKTKKFNSEEVIESDKTLYAEFIGQINDFSADNYYKYYDENIESTKKVTIISDKKITKQEFLLSVKIEAVTGTLPETLDVEVDKNEYTIVPGESGYTPGKIYKISISDGFRFKDFDKCITEYSFRIYKDNIENVKLNENIKYILSSDVKLVEDSNDESDESESLNHNFIIKKNVVAEEKIVIDDILCISEKKEYNPDISMFVRVNNITELEENYYLSTTESPIEDIFSEIDVCFEKDFDPEELIKNLDTKEMEKQILEGEGFKKMTTLLAGSILTSDSIKTKLSSSPEFTENAYVNEDTLVGLSAELAKGATAYVGIGTGFNPNFDEAYENDFLVLTFTFTYEATIKNKIDISVELEFTQYLAMSMQGYMDYCLKLFKKKWLEFEYALNIYSQTDMDLTVLIRSVDKKEEEYKDISKEIQDKLTQNDDEDDSSNVAEMLNEMLESDNGYIDLFRGKILRIEVPVIPGIPVLQVNFDLDFVVKVNFAIALNADASVLQATQIGAYGDTRTGEIGAIQNKLPGGDQYSIEVSACGYIGLKAGFEGGLTISFFKTSYFGKVGLFVFVGPYVDMYGFAKVSLSKVGKYEELGKYVRSSVIGGYYIEIGVNVEVSLEFRSKFFKTKIGATLVDEKIKLFSFGDKEVLLDVDSKSDETVHMTESTDSEKTVLDYKELVNPIGEYINITTGKTTNKRVNWKKFYLSFSNPRFTYDSEKGLIYYDRSKNDGLPIDECIMTYYYVGPCLQFNMNSLSSAERYPAGKVKIIWADTKQVDEDNIGKQFDVKVRIIVDNKLYSETGYKVVAGNKLGYVSTGLNDDYIEGTWDIDPQVKVINGDTTFTYTTKKKQIYVAFIYYNELKNVWVTELRASFVGEKPIAPGLPEEKYSHFKNWRGENGVNNHSGITYTNDLALSIDAEQLGYCLSGTIFTDEPIDRTLLSYESSSYEEAKQGLRNNYYNDTHLYTRVMHIYSAVYETETAKASLVMKNKDGSEYIYEMDVNKGEKLDISKLYFNSPIAGRLIGFSYNKDGSDMKVLSELEEIYEDTTLYAVYEYQKNTARILYYDAVKEEYETFKDITILGNRKVSENDLNEASKALVKVDGVEYTLVGWQYKNINEGYTAKFDTSKIILEDIEIYPVYARKFKVKFDANGGTIIGDEEIEISEYNNFYLCLAVSAIKESKEYKYVFECWKDINTGIEYKNGEEINTLRKPTTFVAQYKETEIIYNLTIETEYGLLLNNEKIEKYQGDYEGYLKLLGKYENYKLDDIREEHYTLVYKDKTMIYDSTGNNITHIYFTWNKIMDRHLLTIDVNGGEDISPNSFEYEYGEEVDLIHLYTTKNKDEYGTYKLKGWKSSTGKEYLLQDKIIIEQDITLSAIWEIDVFEEYKIYYYVNEELISTQVYHLEDEIKELERPEDTKPYKFSGWKWYDGDNEISKPEKMPSKDLIVKATTEKVYVIYTLDGKIYKKVTGNANINNQLIEVPAKKGYTVSNWASNDVTIENGYFMMPEKDIEIKSTSTVNKYKLTYKHNGVDYVPAQEVEYGQAVVLPSLPVQEGVFYEWTSNDIELVGSGFTMPDKDVTITTISSTVRKHLIYYINNEIVSYELVVPGKKISLQVNGFEGNFSGWYSQNVEIVNNMIVMPNDDVIVYGFYTKGNIKINMYLDNKNTPSIVLYANKGEIVINPYFEGRKIECWSINEERIEQIYVDENQSSEINAYAIFAGAYKVSYKTTDLLEGTYDDEYYNANDKVYLKKLPSMIFTIENCDVYGWYSIDEIEILTDENNDKYFIMPDHNVTFNASIRDLTSEGGYYARLYLITPFSNDKVKYRDYYVYSNDGPVYFDIPEIEGCEFVHWQDENGNIYDSYNGIYLRNMNESDQVITGIYKVKTFQVATFKIDGKIYAYRTFYSSSIPNLLAPKPELPNGTLLSDWYSPYGVVKGDGFYLTNEMIGRDLVFEAFTYSSEGEFNCELIIESELMGEINVSFIAKDKDTIKISNQYNDKEYNVQIIAKVTRNGLEEEIIVSNNCIIITNNIITITLPEKNTLSESEDLQIISYIIKLSKKE